MATRQILLDGAGALRKKCKKVGEVNDHIRLLLNDMMDTLHHTENGAALAANQVGILWRLVVIDYCSQQLKLVNPEIIEQSGTQECIEACLSFPNRTAKTRRPQRVTVRALDENGQSVVFTGEDELAKCFCHELDHLDGIIFLDHAEEDAVFGDAE